MTLLFGGPTPLPPQTGSEGGLWMLAVAVIVMFAIVAAVALVRAIYPAERKPAAKETTFRDLRKAA